MFTYIIMIVFMLCVSGSKTEYISVMMGWFCQDQNRTYMCYDGMILSGSKTEHISVMMGWCCQDQKQNI